MFSYFKNKQEQRPQSGVKGQKQRNEQQQINQGMIKLPANIMSQIISQNITQPLNQLISQNITPNQRKQQQKLQTDNKPYQQVYENDQKQNKNVCDDSKDENIREKSKVNSQLKIKTNNIQDQNKTNVNTVKSQQLVHQIVQNQLQQTQVLSKPQQLIPAHKLSSEIKNKLNSINNHPQLSHISTNQLQLLTQTIVDILLQLIQQQKIGAQLQSTLGPQLLKSTGGTQLSFSHQQLTKSLSQQTLSIIRQLSSSYHESFLLQTKQKYNQLVDQSTNLYAKSRQIADYVHQFLLSINLFFQSQQLLVPAQQIHKSISQLNPSKTQKFINYLIKIFQSNFDQVIQKKTKLIKSSLQNELRKSQKQIKHKQTQIKRLQTQIKTLNQFIKSKQTIYIENENKFIEKQTLISTLRKQIQQLNSKCNTISSMNKQSKQDYNSQLMLLKRQLQRNKKQTQQFVQRSNKLQKVIQKKDKLLKTKQEQIGKLQLAVKQVKQTQDQGLNKIIQQIQLKQKAFNTKIQKFSTQKINLQTKIRTLTVDNNSLLKLNNQLEQTLKNSKQEISRLLQQIRSMKQTISQLKDNQKNKQRQEKNKRDTQKGDIQQELSQKQKNINSNINEQQLYQEQHKQVDLSKLVNKQIMAHLFLSYQDQSKQWAIRNNIKNQIYILLDINKSNLNNTTKINIVNKTKPQHQNILQQQQQAQKQQKSKLQQPSIIGKWLGW